MGSRGQSGRDKDARDIVGQYSLDDIGKNKAKILSFFREMDKMDDEGVESRFQEEASELAEKLSESMVYRNDDAKDEFNTIRRQIGNTTYNIAETDRDSIADFNQYIRSKENFLKIGKRGLPIDSAYEELEQLFPGRFPDDIQNPADQLLRINSVLGELKANRIIEATEQEKEEAIPSIYEDLANAYNEIRRRKRKRALNFGAYSKRSSGGTSGSYSSYNEDEELPFF